MNGNKGGQTIYPRVRCQVCSSMIRHLRRYLKKQRTPRFAQSNLITLLTKPIWQHDRVRAWMGTPLVAAAIVGANLSAPKVDTLQAWDISQPATMIPGYTLQSDHTYLLPVAELTGISQYFHQGHPGIDFRAPLKSSVVAIDSGKVTQIIESTTGYGRHVYVEQANNKIALYAHLGLIMVEEGDQLKAGDKIGEIGLTGWTTGPHLHFELRVDNAAVNPIPYLSKALASL